MARKPGLFPTFFLSGFECSTFLWKDRRRRDLVAETQHRQHAREDYRILQELGIAVAREGIPWPMVDGPAGYDFAWIDPLMDAMREARSTPIWDLCHYGYPDGLDPFSDQFSTRFANYCRAAAEHVCNKLPGPCFFTPINEITFFSFCGGEWGWVAPYRNSKPDRHAFREALCKAAIAGVQAIREVNPEARMVHVDPLVVGVNNYSFGQMEYREHGPHQALDPGHPGIRPLCELLGRVWQRYGRPMVIAETSGMNRGRADWLRDVMNEAMAAVNEGMDLHGICLFPAIDMPDWHTGEWLHNGICDLVPKGGDLRRVPFGPYVEELRRWQKELNRVTTVDEDPYSDPVELQDVIDAARRLQPRPDADWS